jgi:hypothetical protein
MFERQDIAAFYPRARAIAKENGALRRRLLGLAVLACYSTREGQAVVV